MRLPLLVLGLALFAATTLCARWDDPEAGMPLLQVPPSHEAQDPMLLNAVMDSRGRLYCAAEYVYEFDGERWTAFPASSGNLVVALAIDDAGRIWCGGTNDLGFLDEDATGTRHFRSLHAQLPPEYSTFRVWDVYCLGTRTLFVCTDAVFIWDGAGFEVHRMPPERRLLSFTFEGAVYISQVGTALWRWDGTGLTTVDLDGHERLAVQGAWRDSRGRAVFLAGPALVRTDTNGAVEAFAEDTIRQIRTHVIVTAVPLPGGDIAVLTGMSGIAILSRDGEYLRHLDRSAGLPGVYCGKLTLDENGVGWVTGERGVYGLDTRNRQTTFTEINALGGDGIRALDMPTGEVLALFTAGIGRLDSHPAAPARFEKLPALQGMYRDMVILPDQSVAAVGLKKFERVTASGAEPLLHTTRDVFHAVVLHANPPTLAVAEESGIAIVDLSLPDSRVRTFTGFPDTIVRLARDNRGTVWGAFYRDGILALDGLDTAEPARRQLTPGGDLPAPFDNPGFFVLRGEPYAFTPGAVVALPAAHHGSVRTIFPGVGLFAAESEGDDVVWGVASRPGHSPRLVQIRPGADGPVLRVTDMAVTAAGHVLSVSRTRGDILWIGGRQGIVRIDAAEVGTEAAPASPIVQAVLWHTGADVRRLPLGSSPTLAFHRTGTVEIKLRDPADPFATAPLIETRLAGANERWQLTGRTRTLVGLDEGTYRLEARIVGFLGNPGPVVRYTFTITPPWFRTPLAYLAYALALGTSIFGAVQWRTRHIRRQNAELEQLVNRRTEELAQAVSARSAFLANMGHEIRNPLNGVVGLVDMLRGRDLPSEQRSLVARIGTCADQLLSVIDDVLEYARIDAGRIALRNRNFTVREPVDAAIDILRAARPEAVLELLGDPATLDATVMGDPDRVRHILVNYVSNALKFGGGTPVEVGVRRDGALLVFSVTDHGPGIPPEEQARLFVRFSRGSAAYRHGIPGTGLGLAACKAYAEAMGGDVSVESEPGKGATFFLRLPFRPATGGRAMATTQSPDLMLGKRALVVDDQDFNRMVLTDLLGRMGATTEQAATLDEARAAFRARRPDIVFVDFDLAGATGADLAAWIRNEAPAGRDVPVVATTAFEVEEVRRRCEEAGMDGFLPKPVTAQRLCEVVSNIETIRSGGPAPAAPTPADDAPMPSSFLDILAGGDPEKRKVIERSSWREVLAEALAAHRALRRPDTVLAARHAHRLVSAALVLSERELVATARELNSLAKAGDLPGARTCAVRLRQRIRAARTRPPSRAGGA